MAGRAAPRLGRSPAPARRGVLHRRPRLVRERAAGVEQRCEEVAELVDPLQHLLGAEPHVVGRADAATSSQVSGVDTHGSGRARRAYGATVVLAALFWLQSTKTLPRRSSLRICETTSLGCDFSSRCARCRA